MASAEAEILTSATQKRELRWREQIKRTVSETSSERGCAVHPEHGGRAWMSYTARLRSLFVQSLLQKQESPRSPNWAMGIG